MAVVVWTGATGDGDQSTAGNYVGGVAPGNGDTIIFRDGNKSMTTATTPRTTLTIIGTDSYTGNIGSASAPVENTSYTLISWNGRGAYAKFSSSSTSTLIKAGLTSATQFYWSSGTVTTVYLSGSGGTFTQEAGAVVTNLTNSSAAVSVSNLGSGATGAYTTVDNAGPMYSSANLGTYRGSGTDSLTGGLTATATAIYLSAGAKCNWQSSGTITLLDLCAGATFDVKQSSSSTGGFTITTLNNHPGSRFNRYPPGVTITITTENAVGFGGLGGI